MKRTAAALERRFLNGRLANQGPFLTRRQLCMNSDFWIDGLLIKNHFWLDGYWIWTWFLNKRLWIKDEFWLDSASRWTFHMMLHDFIQWKDVPSCFQLKVNKTKKEENASRNGVIKYEFNLKLNMSSTGVFFILLCVFMLNLEVFLRGKRNTKDCYTCSRRMFGFMPNSLWRHCHFSLVSGSSFLLFVNVITVKTLESLFRL